MIIYSITHIKTGRQYIGSAINQRRRWNHHRWELEANRHCNPHLQNAWNKYGSPAFVFEVLEAVTDQTTLYEREQYWIDRTTLKFNICPVAGSALGRKATEETRSKLRAARKGFTHTPETIAKLKARLNEPEVKARMLEMNKGRKHTPESVVNMSVGRKGRRHSAETRAKMSEAHKGYVKSDEHRHNLSLAHKGRAKSPETIEKLRQAGKARFASADGIEKLREMARLSNIARRKNKQIAEAINA